jgi:membrane protease YdiL (CAAX protease family)
MALFSLIHITGYIGCYPPKTLVLCFLQYLPAAYCLNFAYRRSGTIAAPILTHMLVNLAALSAMR